MTKNISIFIKTKKLKRFLRIFLPKTFLKALQLSLGLITLNPIHSWNSLVFISREFWK